MQVRIVESGNDTATFQVNDLRVWPAFIPIRFIHTNDASILDGDTGGFGMFRIERGDATVLKNKVGRGLRIHRCIGLLFFFGMQPAVEEARNERHHHPGQKCHDADHECGSAEKERPRLDARWESVTVKEAQGKEAG
jgi:hypothetical protein